MGSHPSQPIAALSELTAMSKLNTMYGSASTHHENKYDSMIAQFEKKKMQIDRELGKMKMQSVSVSLKDGWRKEREREQPQEGDTPKFANKEKGELRREYRSVSSVMDGASRKEKRVEKDPRRVSFIASLKKHIELEERLRNAKLAIPK